MTNYLTIDYQSFTNIDTSKEERRELNVGDYYSNSAKCHECGQEIRSRNRHDMVFCSCGKLAVDGGSWYLKRIGYSSNYTDTSVLYNDAKEK